MRMIITKVNIAPLFQSVLEGIGGQEKLGAPERHLPRKEYLMKRVAVIVACVACMAGAAILVAAEKATSFDPVKTVKQHVIKKKLLDDLGL